MTTLKLCLRGRVVSHHDGPLKHSCTNVFVCKQQRGKASLSVNNKPKRMCVFLSVHIHARMFTYL